MYPRNPRHCPHLYAGVILVAVFWTLNWGLTGMRTHVLFFPLWLGYCLTVDGILVRRRGHSPLTRNPLGYAGLFVASIPAWWLFEVINWRTDNWSYLGRAEFGPAAYFLIASLSFSTVIPAVFGTAELIASATWIERFRNGPRLAARASSSVAWLVAGSLMLSLVLWLPDWFFPLVWTSVFFILEPVNARLGRPTLVASFRRGDWRGAAALAAGALVCGFFWEMWNFLSFPKWIYRVPHFDFARVFEMPLPGYGGYLPFSLELFALYQLVIALTRSSAVFRRAGGDTVQLPGVE